MQEEKTREQLLEENARLRALLAQVREAYALLEVVVRMEENVLPMVPAGAPLSNIIYE